MSFIWIVQSLRQKLMIHENSITNKVYTYIRLPKVITVNIISGDSFEQNKVWFSKYHKTRLYYLSSKQKVINVLIDCCPFIRSKVKPKL